MMQASDFMVKYFGEKMPHKYKEMENPQKRFKT